MSTISITWYGHSCFKISYDGRSAVFDPYKDHSVPGLTLQKDITADAVYCSHQHDDHNAAELIHVKGTADPFPTWTITVPHDDADGQKRGMTDIRFIQAGKCTLAHLGDIGRIPTDEEYGELSKADILFVPSGGYFTIDAGQAKEIIERIKPKLAILMHYRNGWGYEVLEGIDDIRRIIPGLKELKENTITFDENSIPGGIVTLEPMQ